MPALSIIVPVYKVEQYLRRCVDSILSQTFTDFELILVDDGSPDTCPAICDEYAEKDERIVVIHKENGGLSDARNAGLDIAKGDYIGFVDSDDWIHPQMYEIMVGVMNAKGVDIVKCDCLWTHDNAVDFDELSVEKSLETAQVIDGRECVDNFYPENRRIVTDMAWDKLYRRKIFAELRYPKGHIFEDAYILLNLLDEAERIAVIDSVLYFYYQREDSIVGASFSAWRARERMITWERHREFFEKKGNITQKNYVLNAYIKYFYHQKMRLCIERPKDKKFFKPAQKAFNCQMKEMFSLDDMCNMKRLMLICLRFYPKMADKIVKKYFPELL